MEKTDWKKLEEGLQKYLAIMNEFEHLDVASHTGFQRRFKGFYRVRRNDAFCDCYFSILQNNKKNKALGFEPVLKELLKFGKMEASFTSKLIATINPDLPAWDKQVLKNIEKKLPYTPRAGDRINETVTKYESIVSFYQQKISSPDGKQLLRSFNERLPNVAITDTKKIDLILWQTRT